MRALLFCTRGGWLLHRHRVVAYQSVWLAANVASQEEVENLRVAGIAVSEFVDSIDPGDVADIEARLATISEHHPGFDIEVIE